MASINHILCPIDFSESSADALEQAAVVAGWYHAHLTALHVSSPTFMAVPGLSAPIPDAQILRVAADEHADLIVLGVHGRGAIDVAMFGSTTNHLVRAAACAVLTLRR